VFGAVGGCDKNDFGRRAACHTWAVIYFRNYHWLPVHGYTRFDALIQTDDQKREDVFWMLDFRCEAGGAEWRLATLGASVFPRSLSPVGL
jgi:hypothetical protein